MLRSIFFLTAISLVGTAAVGEQAPNFVFCCQPGNDLYRVLGGEKSGYPRFTTAAEAVQAAVEGAGVLI